ncbi:MAG: hypothetical protein JRH15_16310 [Deltaproteobacteria bacterium]|nr:hypothetical protein [Deltaproteobacteria bacterium]
MKQFRRSMCMVIPVVMLLVLMLPDIMMAQSQYMRHDDLFSIYFVNKDQGWVCGRWGVIWHTNDGGKTWERQETGTTMTLSAIDFVDSQNGWAVGNGGTILHTSDGGKAWRQQKSPVEFFHMGVDFVNPQEGWIASEKTHILHTVDGGQTWDVQFSGEVYHLKSISFADSQNGWAAGEFGFVYGTRDGGNTWQYLAGKYEFNEDTYEIETGVFIFDIVSLDSKTVLAVGSDGVVTRSGDGGRTWNIVDIKMPESRFYSAAKGQDGDVVIGGTGAYLLSQDSGVTWAPIEFEPSMKNSWIYSFSHIRGKQYVAVGEEGVIYLGDVSKVLRRVIY